MADRPRRPWCARCRYPGLEPFLFGTVWTDGREGEEAARRAAAVALREVYPAEPEIVAVVPGQVVFVEDGDG